MTANDTASPDIKVSIRGGPIRWLIVGGVFLIAAIMIGTTIMAGNFRERALNIAEPDGSSWIVRAVVNIAAERRMTTTAEGVETQQQQQLLRALGCSEMQAICSARQSRPRRSGTCSTRTANDQPQPSCAGSESASNFQAQPGSSSEWPSWQMAGHWR